MAKYDYYRLISLYVWTKFSESRKRGITLHDIDLRKWALKVARDSNFTSSKLVHNGCTISKQSIALLLGK